jgi:cysteinyl-tRNA synthetase
MAGLINRYIDAHRLETDAPETDGILLAAVGRALVDNGRLLGLFEAPPEKPAAGGLEGKLVELMIQMRAEARADKNFALADRIRDGLGDLGVVLEDTANGTLWRRD